MKKRLIKTLAFGLIFAIAKMATPTSSSNLYPYNLINNKNINMYANAFLAQEFNMELDIPLYYAPLDEGINATIYFNDKIILNENLINGDQEFIEKVLIHELCHYNLEKNENACYLDGANDFELMLKKYGSISNFEDLNKYNEPYFKSRLSGQIK